MFTDQSEICSFLEYIFSLINYLISAKSGRKMSTTTTKTENFIATPMGNKRVSEVGGIGDVAALWLTAAGIITVSILYSI